ncbi:helix-turn-helix transcriptional regulator [Mycolicibacterium thermoresistibile]
MGAIDDFSRVVAAVYAAAVEPASWVATLEDISRSVDALGGALIMPKAAGRMVKAASVPLPAQHSYREYYHTVDYVLDAVEAGPVGLVRSGAALRDLKKGSEFDVDFMRPNQLDDGLFVRLCGDRPTPSFLAVGATVRPAFDQPERVRFLNALTPHLRQALRTEAHLARSVQDLSETTGVVDSLRHGIVVVDPTGDVVRINVTAADLTDAGDGLQMRAGRLGAQTLSTQRELEQAIVAATRPGPDPCGGSLLCHRPSGKRAYVVHVLPLGRTDRLRRRALVVIVDPECQPEPPAELLRRLYGLTRAEAQIALGVLRGEGLKPLAEELALSLPTVKTHLQHVFDKTATHRQAELVRLLLRITP